MNLALHHNYDSRIGLISGLVCGLGKYLLQIHEPFIINLAGAILTAFICGIAGVAGKELFTFLKKKIKLRK